MDQLPDNPNIKDTSTLIKVLQREGFSDENIETIVKGSYYFYSFVCWVEKAIKEADENKVMSGLVRDQLYTILKSSREDNWLFKTVIKLLQK